MSVNMRASVSVYMYTCRNMVKNDTPPIAANMREKKVDFILISSGSGSANT